MRAKYRRQEEQLDMFAEPEKPRYMVTQQARNEAEAHILGNVVKVAVAHNYWRHVYAKRGRDLHPWATDADTASTLNSVGGLMGAW